MSSEQKIVEHTLKHALNLIKINTVIFHSIRKDCVNYSMPDQDRYLCSRRYNPSGLCDVDKCPMLREGN